MFLAYIKHESEKENIIQKILEAARNGDNQFSIQLDDDFSDEEIDYIIKEVKERINK